MSQSIEESLLQAIKNDDTKAFDALMDKAQCGAYRLGRFPVLSLLYLYKARKILSLYEETFLKVTNSIALGEPMEISKKFSSKAGKCLRLYFNEVVSPLEMLLILDKASHLKKVYPLTNPSSAVKARLKSIYSIKYSLLVKFEGNQIIIERRPLSYKEKKKIATVCVSVFLAIVLAVTTIIVVPKPVKPVEGEVMKLSDIDFASTKTYTLKKDITLPDKYTVEKVNCKIVGDNHKLSVGKGVSLGELNGELSGVTIESAGEVIFTSIARDAKISNVTVNVKASVESSTATSFLAITNYGEIDGVTLNVSGSLSAKASTAQVTDEIYFGGLVQENSYKYGVGVVKNCKVNYSKFNLFGESSANATFGGVVGFNSAYLQDSVVTGEIVADTFDVAGVCSLNNGVLSGNENQANIAQTSVSTSWNPITCGITLKNYYLVENCENTGKVSSISNCSQLSADAVAPSVTAASVAYLNGGEASIEKCKNSGDIYASGSGEASIGGIVAVSYGYIYNSINGGKISVKSQTACVGGILGTSPVATDRYIYYAIIKNCIGQCKIDVNTDGVAYVGGIVGKVDEKQVQQYKYDENGNLVIEDNSVVVETVYRGGVVDNCYFIGENVSNVNYFGNIVGVCGANIYQSNSYFSVGKEYHNFKDNYYLENSFGAFGATIAGEDINAQVDDKGANVATIDYIQNLKGYKDILTALGK